MANSVVIGMEGDSALYMVDLDARTVAPIEGTDQGTLAQTGVPQSEGVPVVRGVSVAVRVAQAPAVSAGHFDGH